MKQRGAPTDTHRFLDALFSAKPEELYILIWMRRSNSKRSRWFRDVRQAAVYVQSLSGDDVYVGVGLSPSDFGEFNRCESGTVAGIVALGADIDLKSNAHPKGTRPSTIEQAQSILPSPLPPTVIVETGNGLQCWWLFKEPWIFENVEERQQAAELSSRWQTLLKYNAQQRGWAFERLADLARVLRVPGTQNVKDPANPKSVTIRSFNDRRYNPSEFVTYLNDLAIPNEDDRARAVNILAQRWGDKTLVVNIAAAVPDEQLGRWMDQDSRFHKTWHHQRTDMHDVSQSGYDLSLACFGVWKGLSDQEIVDLIIHNRRVHGAKQSQSLDYFRRTISKAHNGVDEKNATVRDGDRSQTVSLTSPIEAGPADDDGAMTRDASDPNAKAKLCGQISTLLGVQVLRILKVTGAEPVYLMELAEGRIQFPNAAKLISKAFVRAAFAARAGKIIPNLKSRSWEEITQMLLDACTIVEGTDDLELEGSARIQIAKYLAEIPFIPSLHGAAAQDRYKPMVDKGRIVISATDFQTYINRTTMQNHSVRYVAAMIAALGGEAVRVRGNSFKEQSRWALPVAEFDPGDYQSHQEGDGGGE